MFRLFGVSVGIALLLATAGPASAATLYVTPAGSETSACPGTDPCSVTRADAIVAPGDTVQVAPGSYGPITLTRGGTSVARVTWLSATRWGAHVPTIYVVASAPFVTVGGFDIGASAGSLVRVDASYSQIVGNHVHDSASVCGTDGGGIVISGYQQDGYNGVGGEVVGNLVENIGAGPRNGTCRTLHGISSSIPQVRIVNNVERRALAFGIHLWHAARDNSVINNTVLENGASGILIGAGDSGATGVTPSAAGDFVANNIVASNVEWGITECCDSSPARGPNRYGSNLGWRNGSGNSADRLIDNVEGGGTVTGSVYGDPRFASASDVHLQSGSAAVDSGTSTNAPASDFDGTARPQGEGVDGGAFEAPPGTAGALGNGSGGGSGSAGGRAIAGFRITPHRVRMSAAGTIRLRLACPRREKRCRVTLRLLRGRKTVASKTASVRGGHHRTVALKLNRSARLALVRAGTLRVTAVAGVRTAAGHRGTTRTTLTLLAPRRS